MAICWTSTLFRLLSVCLLAVSLSSVSGILQRCPWSPTTCCQYQAQLNTRCSFESEANSCGVWQANPGERRFVTYDDGLSDPVTGQGGEKYGVTDCLASAGTNAQAVEPAIFQSDERVWTRTGQDARLHFHAFVPSGLSRLSNLTISAVFPSQRKSTVLMVISSSVSDGWTFSQLNLPSLGAAYTIRFTAFSTCDEIIGLDDIWLENLISSNATGCLTA